VPGIIWQFSEVLPVSAILAGAYPEGITANSPGSATKERHPGLLGKHARTLKGHCKTAMWHAFQGALFHPSIPGVALLRR
jgi:hypothetical protein